MSEHPADFDPLIDQAPSRYVVGIDLGTTNCAVTYVDTRDPKRQVSVFPILQVIAPGETEERETLPSFHFQPPESELAADAMRLPWHKKKPGYCVGVFARNESANTAGRAIASAKSWLCHAGVDRTAALLPWQGASDVERLSPVEASARYLEHIRRAWNQKFSTEKLEDQEIVLTLPASFDEVARTLTIEAARQAKLPRVILIEEPQAAFYAWVNKHQQDWSDQVNVGQKILVCDIGGGTTDFTLIRVRESEVAGEKVQFHRVAVGQHLILGGDNLDLALAKYLENKLTSGGRLEPEQWDLLVGRARQHKEDLLGPHPPKKLTVKVPGRGSRLIGGSLQTEVTAEEVQQLLIDGFLPDVELGEQPERHGSGFQEFGLPYAADPAITKYLSAFLVAHQDAAGTSSTPTPDRTAIRPDVVLFNGGFFDSPLLKQKLISVMEQWFRTSEEPEWSPILLENDRLDLAVARGAAYYGLVRRGEGVRIAASLARSYYIGVETEKGTRALCVVPGSAEPGQRVDLPQREFLLTLSQPVEFSLFVSSTRLADKPGELYEIDPEQLTALPPIRTVIKATSRNEKRDVAVNLKVNLTEIGTIDLACQEVGSERSWKLQFDIRSAVNTDQEAHQGAGEAEGFVDEETWQACYRKIHEVFSAEGQGQPSKLVKELAETLGAERHEWPMSLLRRMWEALFELAEGRKKSAAHEARWLNLLGFSLRPGYGFAVDDWRVTETWRHVKDKLHHESANSRAAIYILWRRLAGGLSRGQQLALADPQISDLRTLTKKLTGGVVKTATLRPEDTAEIWRMLGSFELLPIERKLQLAGMIQEIQNKKSMAKIREVLVWTLGRLGQRTPLYGPLNTVIPVAQVEPWLREIISSRDPDRNSLFAAVQLARRTHDRYRDISDSTRADVIGWLEMNDAGESLVRLVAEGGELDAESQDRAFGESLPKGLKVG